MNIISFYLHVKKVICSLKIRNLFPDSGSLGFQYLLTSLCGLSCLK